MNIFVSLFWWTGALIFPEYILKYSGSRYVCLLWLSSTSFPKYSSLYSHQQFMSVPVVLQYLHQHLALSILLALGILVSMLWYFIVVFIYITLMKNDVKQLFITLIGHLYHLFYKVLCPGYFLLFCCCFVVVVWPHLAGMRDLSSPTRDWPCTPLQWKLRVLTTSLDKAREVHFVCLFLFYLVLLIEL